MRSDAPAPSQPIAGSVDLRVAGRVGGAAGAALLDGAELLVGSGTQVIRLDVTDPRTPREIDRSAPLAGTVLGLARYDGLVLAATGEAGLAILDPAEGLSLRGSIDLRGVAHDIAMVGSTALVADGPAGLRMVDLSDPAAPVEVASLLDLHQIIAVAAAGERAYLAAADEGLLVVDVSAPAAPRVLGSRFTGGYAFGVAIAGPRVLLADGWAGLQIVDATDGAAPAVVATMRTSAWVMDVSVVDDRAYLAAGLEGVRVVDLADPANPREVAAKTLPGGHATAVSTSADRAAVVDAGAGVRLFDVSGEPVELGIHAPLSTLNGLAVVGERVFLASKGQGLRIVDVSNAEQPVERPGVATSDLVWQVAAAGGRIFFGTVPRPESLFVGSMYGFDASGPGPYVPGAPLGGGGGPATAVDGSLIITAAELNVWLLDGSRPEPCLLGVLETKEFLGEGFEANGVTIAGTFAYVAPFYDAIRVIDVADPRHPRILAPAQGPAEGKGIGIGKTLAVGRTLYAIGRDGSAPIIAVYSLDDPTAPRLMGTVDLPAETATSDQTGPQMAYGGGRLFVADEVGGLIAIDVSDPTHPVLAGRLRLPGDVIGVAVVGDQAYVASDGGGLFVVEWSATTPAALLDRGAVDPGSLPEIRPQDATGAEPAAPAMVRSASSPKLAPAVAQSTCLVTSAADAGPGSLRSCLEQATDGLRITFDIGRFPPDRPAAIRLERGLPVVEATGVSIDASGAGVILDGGGSIGVGLELRGDRGLVSGLQVVDFAGFGIRVEGAGNTIRACVVSGNVEGGITLAFAGPGNRIVSTLVGPDASGSRVRGPQAVGIDLGHGTVVGGPDPGDRNVISGNQLEILFKAVRGSVVEGNYIGTDAAGGVTLRAPDAGWALGVWVGSTGNRIAGNVIVGGISVLDPGSSYNVIVGNRLGVDATATRSFEEGGTISIDEPFNAVGGTMPGEGNIVSGAIIAGAPDVIVVGNQVGIGADDAAIGDEPRIAITKPGVIVGGTAPGASNVVRGAIAIAASRAIVIGNQVDGRGRTAAIVIDDVDSSHVLANIVRGANVGIHLRRGALGNTIRGNEVRGSSLRVSADEATRGNVISGNAFVGASAEARDRGTANAWDDGRHGNYWSGSVSVDADGDGIVDVERVVGPGGVDRYPLAEPP